MHVTARRHARLSAANAAEAIRAILTLPLPQALTLALTPSLSLSLTLSLTLSRQSAANGAPPTRRATSGPATRRVTRR